MDLVLAKGHVAHGKVKEIVRVVRVFKAVHGDVRLLVELLGNPPGEGIQLHAVELGILHPIRQQAEEVADATGRLQNVPRSKAHALHRLIHGLDDRGIGVVGIEDGAAGGFIFLWGQQLFEFRVFFGPLLIVRVKRLGHAAPAHIAGEGFLFLGRGKAALRLDLFQGADGRHVILIFGFLAAHAQVIVGDAEVVPLRASAKLLEHHVKRAGVDGAHSFGCII